MRSLILCTLLVSLAPTAFADAGFEDFEDFEDFDDELPPEDEKPKEDRGALGTTIFGTQSKTKRIASPANVIDEKTLDQREADDPARVLRVPGVNPRDEDGFGLRPNIGMRGASSDRSSKVTLMEDGVLFAPAPYAAPAAYYFPLMTRMVGIEVMKGAAAIQAGPQTVGGAINFRTRRVPTEPLVGRLDIGAGARGAAKFHGFAGANVPLFGGLHGAILAEVAHLRHNGFKTLPQGLPGGGNTGFDRTDAMLKARLSSPEDAATYQALELKLGFGNETSQETYLGLTDADFALDPNRRYAATQLALMKWNRTQAELSYVLSTTFGLDLRVTAYRTDFARAWRKLNRFRDGPDLAVLLKNPEAGSNAVFTSILRGQNSDDPARDLMIGTNARSYYTNGIQAVGAYTLEVGPMSNEFELGVRLHSDAIERNHTEVPHAMVAGILTPTGGVETTVQNRGAASAGALYARDVISIGDLIIVPGLRLEVIRTDFIDRLSGDESDALQFAWMPGAGISYTVADAFTVLAGVHRGFSPVSPGQPPDAEPESSLNYEAGMRFGLHNTRAELVGFFNQYGNLTGECTFSTGCDDTLIGRQFNGGEVWVWGAEALLSQGARLPGNLWYQVDVNYTWTKSQFQTAFLSQNPQFGDVQIGDELAYVPEHQGAVSLMLAHKIFDITTTVAFTSAMRDEAGQGPKLPTDGNQSSTVVDIAAGAMLTDKARLYVTVDNLFNQRRIVARRPFGARPGKPLSFMSGLKLSF